MKWRSATLAFDQLS